MKKVVLERQMQYNKIRRKRRRNNLIAKITVAVILVIAAVNFVSCLSSSKNVTEKIVFPEEIDGISVYTDLLSEGIPGRPGIKREIKYIAIHETDNEAPSADAEAHNGYIHEIAEIEKISWHYTVDDHQIYHHLPDNEISFNAGDTYTKDGGNMNAIAIEMCVNEGGDYEKTLENAAKLTAYLMNEYNLDINDVKKHQDFSGKICPSRLIKSGRWEEFLKKIEKYM